jgi:hypothetical protein
MIRATAIFLFTTLTLPGSAGAELCRRPDGSYTNQCSANDEPVEGGSVIRAEAGPRRASDAAGQASPAADPGAADELERYWREQRNEARRELRRAERVLVYARQEYGDCRARQHAALGTALFHSCDQGQLETAERAVEEARSYLEEGLFEECRRSSSCLAAWVRP